MEINIYDIPKVVINLPERTERLQQFKDEIKKIFNDDIHLIEGVYDRISYKGIARAHKNAIQLALDNNWKNVLIMEDDVLFQAETTKTIDYINKAFKSVPDNFDVLLSGIYTSSGLKPYNEYWQQTGNFSALHFYVVNKKAYQRILDFDESQHIDQWMAKAVQHKGGGLTCYVAKEFFAIQRVGFSDNVGQYMDYDYLLKKYKLLK